MASLTIICIVRLFNKAIFCVIELYAGITSAAVNEVKAQSVDLTSNGVFRVATQYPFQNSLTFH